MKILSNIFILIFFSSLIGCSYTSNDSTYAILQDGDESAQDSITLFGVKSERDPLRIINNLIDVDILTLDPDRMSIKNDNLKAAVVLFKGLGMSGDFIRTILAAIHEESVRQQLEIVNGKNPS